MQTEFGDVLGILGGTFDPVHFGHLRLAEEACQHLGLKEVLWIPSGQPKHRITPEVCAAQRLQMVRLALVGNPKFCLDSTEVDSPLPSYTVPTLERLRVRLGANRPLVLLLGADAFAGLTTWHRWKNLLELAHIGLAHRPGSNLNTDALPEALTNLYNTRRSEDITVLSTSPYGRIVPFAMTQLAISATHIRTLLANSESPRYLLPEAVIDYIHRHQIYRKL